MDKLEEIHLELKSTANSRIYLVSYFDEIRNQIDVECETYLSKIDSRIKLDQGKREKQKEKAIEQQQEFIKEVDLFQQECLKNLGAHPIEPLNFEELERRLNSVNLKNNNSVLELEKELYCTLYNRKKLIFMNKGILFLSLEKYKKFCGVKMRCSNSFSASRPQKSPDILFGILLLVEDEFIIYNEEKIMQTSNDKINRKSRKNNDDWCNEYLRIKLIKDLIEDYDEFKLSWNLRDRKSVLDVKAVNRIRLNLKQREGLTTPVRFFAWKSRTFLKHLSVYLPSLKKVSLTQCELKEFEPTVFHGLHNLEELELNRNRIEALHKDSFRGLVNLTWLDLSENKITLIPDGLFQGLARLESLYLHGNQISVIRKEMFRGLSRLKNLDLSSNKLSQKSKNNLRKELAHIKWLDLNSDSSSSRVYVISFDDGSNDGLDDGGYDVYVNDDDEENNEDNDEEDIENEVILPKKKQTARKSTTGSVRKRKLPEQPESSSKRQGKTVGRPKNEPTTSYKSVYDYDEDEDEDGENAFVLPKKKQTARKSTAGSVHTLKGKRRR